MPSPRVHSPTRAQRAAPSSGFASPVAGLPPLAPERLAACRAIGRVLTGARDVVLTTHVNPDGDGLGAEAALAAWLRGRGVAARILNPGPPPRAFAFLASDSVPLAVFRGFDADGLDRADALVVVDAPVGPRLGAVAEALPRLRAPVVRIDHHATAEPAGELDLVDAGASSTAELVFRLLTALGEAIPPEAAAALYAGIAFDTGSFRYANTTRETHLVVAELHRLGVRPERVYAPMYAAYTLARMHLWGQALAGMRLECGGRLAWMAIDRGTLARTGASAEDLEGLVEQGRRIAGVAVSLLLREESPGETKVSLRSSGPVDVSALAARFGGGGHVNAAGATLPLPLEEAAGRVLVAARELLEPVATTARHPGAGGGSA